MTGFILYLTSYMSLQLSVNFLNIYIVLNMIRFVFRSYKNTIEYSAIINRPGVTRSVLPTPLSLID